MKKSDTNSYRILSSRINRYTYLMCGFSAALGSSFATSFTTASKLPLLYPEIFVPSVIAAAGLAFCGIKKENNRHSIRYCDEYMELKDSYNNIRNQILDSIKNFNLTKIEEIFAYASYLLNNGYLSYDKSLISAIDDVSVKQIDEILKELALNAHGRADSKSLLVADLINSSSEYSLATILTGNIVDQSILSAAVNDEEVRNHIEELNDRNDLGKKNNMNVDQELVEYLISTGKVPYVENPRGKKINHALTIGLNDQAHSYYFDVENEKFLYNLNGFNNVLVGDNIAFSIAPKNYKKKNWHDDLPPIAVEGFSQESPEVVGKRYKEARELILSNPTEIDNLYNNIQPELEKAENAYQKILKSC